MTSDACPERIRDDALQIAVRPEPSEPCTIGHRDPAHHHLTVAMFGRVR
jgi:hypothetical protein